MKHIRIYSIYGVLAAALLSFSATAETTLRIGLASLPNYNGNPYMESARTTWYTLRALFDTLTKLGKN